MIRRAAKWVSRRCRYSGCLRTSVGDRRCSRHHADKCVHEFCPWPDDVRGLCLYHWCLVRKGLKSGWFA